MSTRTADEIKPVDLSGTSATHKLFAGGFKKGDHVQSLIDKVEKNIRCGDEGVVVGPSKLDCPDKAERVLVDFGAGKGKLNILARSILPPQGSLSRVEGARIAIVGAGIGGLALAVALQLRSPGLSVTIFERSDELKTRGGQIGIWREGLQVLNELGMGDEIAKVLVDIHRFTSSYNGQEKCGIDLPAGTRVRVMREALHQILLKRLCPGTLRLGSAIEDVREASGGKATVVLATGIQETFDLVVGADGVKSSIAERVFGPQDPQFVGIVSLVCIARAGHRPEPGVFQKHFIESEETGRFRVLSATGGGLDGLWDYVSVSVSVPLEAPVSSDWDCVGTKAEILDHLELVPGGAAPERAIVEDAERVFRWGIYETKPKPTWVSRDPPVVLIGDSAHAMAPYLGRGANEALLDAWCLATELSRTGQTVLVALHAFQRERKTVTEKFQLKARMQMGKFFDEEVESGLFHDAELHVPRTGLVEHGLTAELDLT